MSAPRQDLARLFFLAVFFHAMNDRLRERRTTRNLQVFPFKLFYTSYLVSRWNVFHARCVDVFVENKMLIVA